MHDTWARYYDFIYDECFGGVFHQLTSDTLALVSRLQPPPARVLDLGAGTGRLALPLAQRGYQVTAVEVSPGMADVLTARALTLGLLAPLRPADRPIAGLHVPPGRDGVPLGTIDVVRANFLDLDTLLGASRAPAPASGLDLAMAIFTVLNYVVHEDDLRRLAGGVAAALRNGGHLVFDLAERRLFAPAIFESDRLHREIEVRERARDVFSYWDSGSGSFHDERFSYGEMFTLRYWRESQVMAVFAEAGLVRVAEITDGLRASGSRWFVLERVPA